MAQNCEEPVSLQNKRRELPMWVRLPVLVLLVMVGVLGWSSMKSTPPTLGVTDGKLLPCPSSPNCVCSTDEDAGHAIAPLAFTGPASEAFSRIKSVTLAMPRTRSLEESTNYLRVEFTTLICRFKDDVEFVLDEQNSVIHVRSASRVGHSDLGVNRKRVEAIRQAFNRK